MTDREDSKWAKHRALEKLEHALRQTPIVDQVAAEAGAVRRANHFADAWKRAAERIIKNEEGP